MNVQPTLSSLSELDAEWLILGIFDDEVTPPVAVAGSPLGDQVSRLIESKDVSGGLGDTLVLPGANTGAKRGVLLVGLGSRERFAAGGAFTAGVAAAKRLASKPRETVAAVLPESADISAIGSAWTEGLLVGTRGPGLRKSEPNRHAFETLLIVASTKDISSEQLTQAIQHGKIVGEAVNLARDLANTPPSEKLPQTFAALAQEAGAGAGLTVHVWDLGTIRHEKFGGLLGVNAGSENPPAFVILEYRKGGDAPTLALVGKGVTFDSGGLSLKPSASMEDMKSDMTGAAVVLGTMQAVARLELPVNIIGYLPLTENMTGGNAMKLGDVLTIRNGKTVEVLNTDAEGRLILADALSYALESAPARILDLATLTGACMVALGTKFAGLFSNDDSFASDVLAACKRTGERAWRLPLDDDFKDGLKSQVADLKNVAGRWGGASTAAKFLEQFVGKTPWVHLDIAGPSWADSDSGARDAGGTGCFVRTLVDLIETSTNTNPHSLKE